ncbi:MAG: hypothetical protein ACRDNW_14500 [Trebonia sp.]
MRPVEASAEWDSLPASLRTAIQARTGKVEGASPTGEGLSTSVRLILRTESGDVFIKGTGPDSTDHQRRRLALGAELAPHVTAVSPPLLWRVVQTDGWDITGWPALPGRPWADQKPGSEDIPKMTRLLTELSQIPAPGTLTDTARERLEHYSDDPSAFDGDAIVHRDPNPTNFVVDGDRAWMVDFGWAVRGPAWMTSANLIVSMMEAGWTAADADDALKAVPAWAGAPRHAVDEHARATVREWDHVTERGPVHEVWQFRTSVARAWAEYRAAI